MAEEHRKLVGLVGRFVGQETLYPSGDDPGGAALARVDARMVLDGAFLMTRYEAERDGHLAYTGIGMTGWDDAMRCYTLHWFDSMGRSSALPATGHWDGSVLRLEQAEPGGRLRYLYVIGADGSYQFRIERTRGGDWAPLVHGAYQREAE